MESKFLTFVDGNQTTTISFDVIPERIISLVPSQTELLYDLGLETSLVGITKFCVHPYHLKVTKTIVGGTKQVHFDTIKALNPDIIICNKEENTEQMVLELSTLCPVFITDISTLDDNKVMIKELGAIFNKRVEAQKWIDKIAFARSDFETFMKDKTIKKAAYFIWAKPYMVSGRDTFITYMLSLNKFQNIYENREERYPEVSIENIQMDGDPDFVFLSSEPFPFKDEHAFEIGRHTHHAKTIFVDGEMFSWYGTRVLKAFDYFIQLHQKL